jgi:hypothetical protein
MKAKRRWLLLSGNASLIQFHHARLPSETLASFLSRILQNLSIPLHSERQPCFSHSRSWIIYTWQKPVESTTWQDKWTVSIGIKCTATVWCYWPAFLLLFQSPHPMTCLYAKFGWARELLGPWWTTLISLAKKRPREAAHIVRSPILSANRGINTFDSTYSTLPMKSG